jgi:hypothetical protein
MMAAVVVLKSGASLMTRLGMRAVPVPRPTSPKFARAPEGTLRLFARAPEGTLRPLVFLAIPRRARRVFDESNFVPLQASSTQPLTLDDAGLLLKQ